jgi:glycosyltransferase involved in cell wall biosynthesis
MGEPLYPRAPATEALLAREPGDLGDYLFYPSRLEILKRQSLAIEAMRHVETPVKLVLVGRGPDERSLRGRIQRLGLGDRVRLEVDVADERLLELYGGALGVFFGPYDEDFGYVTIEGFAAARPLVTLTDSGGPLEFVRDRETGLIAPPKARPIAAAFDRLWSDREAARSWGLAGNKLVRETVPEWPQVVTRLLG